MGRRREAEGRRGEEREAEVEWRRDSEEGEAAADAIAEADDGGWFRERN